MAQLVNGQMEDKEICTPDVEQQTEVPNCLEYENVVTTSSVSQFSAALKQREYAQEVEESVCDEMYSESPHTQMLLAASCDHLYSPDECCDSNGQDESVESDENERLITLIRHDHDYCNWKEESDGALMDHNYCATYASLNESVNGCVPSVAAVNHTTDGTFGGLDKSLRLHSLPEALTRYWSQLSERLDSNSDAIAPFSNSNKTDHTYARRPIVTKVVAIRRSNAFSLPIA